MGLFSKLFKNKQESTGVDSGFYVPPEEQSPGVRARSKRASNAGGAAASRRGGKDGPDPVLPEKKRARRRLVGAIALALGVAVGLPMLLDSEPKQLASDIDIQIPSKEKAVTAPQSSAPPARVADSAALDQSEEIITDTEAAKPAAKPAVVPAAPVVAQVRSEPKPESKPEPKPESKPVERIVEKPVKVAEAKPAAKPEVKHEAKVEARAEPKHETKPEPKPELKPEPKPEKPEVRVVETKPAEPKHVEPKPASKPVQSADDAARALAILEGKPAVKLPDAAPSSRYLVQVAALATQEKVDELQGKLRDAGLSSFTQKTSNASGERVIRVRIGPFGSKDEADKTRARLQKIGLGGSLVPL